MKRFSSKETAQLSNTLTPDVGPVQRKKSIKGFRHLTLVLFTITEHMEKVIGKPPKVTWGSHETAIPSHSCCKTSPDGAVAWTSGTGKLFRQVLWAGSMGKWHGRVIWAHSMVKCVHW